MTDAAAGSRRGPLRLSRFRRGLTTVRLSPARIDADAALALVRDGAVLIDVRQQDDPSRFLDGAERVAPRDIPGHLADLPRDTPIVLACS